MTTTMFLLVVLILSVLGIRGIVSVLIGSAFLTAALALLAYILLPLAFFGGVIWLLAGM